ncbi:hypothetical protein NEDG_00893 [Nematocida displodere]|uniref:PUM-HD domain-containing protein n=1 Tax=Nematocida displodere TaxID=1805483 RepID=A0A177EEB9_9MICR|nr:hypothetical protein NEDG_00893 [Nematocida displodere]
MEGRKIHRDKSYCTAITTLTTFDIKAPIKNLPHMENLLERDSDGKRFRNEPTAIARPTETICIRRILETRDMPRKIKLCLECSVESPCTNCECTGPQKHDDLDEFIDAGKRDDVSEQTLSTPQLLICTACPLSATLHLLPDEESVAVAVFASRNTSVAFFNAHKHFLMLEFLKGPGVQRQAPCGRDFPRSCEGFKLRIIEKAFSEHAAPSFASGTHLVKPEPVKRPRAGPNEPEAIGEIVYLASGRHSNIALQARLKACSQEALQEMLHKISAYSFFFLAKHKYGTYVIQLLISMAGTEALVGEIKELIMPYASLLLQHNIGNYVVQRMIAFDPRFVLDCFLSDFEKILRSKIGSRAFKSSAKFFCPYREDVLPRLLLLIEETSTLEDTKVLKAALKDLSVNK